ncbi:hypothetical protein MF621_003984 (plasmid) [Bacillus velezensis]|uniref:hypothetical protein n=1 Tax=Bacillus velezensis TaxID=492670 RepID=UPI00049EF2D5|nr:hypothetical protein [Bacillus velezensis]KDN91224.1 hypothetical protein EF87_20015 [Bacillus amyloliquefaciens]URJ76449.1 hypothetical protein MF619_004022 [Bacillus velezensis]URJ80405.1 hypothetical protein MF621_003984 [Bacillus velezensis]
MSRKRSKDRHKNRNRNSEGHPSYEYQKFASTSAYSKQSGVTSGSGNVGSISESRLKTMLQDPSSNAQTISNLSLATKGINGMYKAVLRYLSSMPTFDHLIYPVLENPMEFKDDPSKVNLSFAQNAIFLDRLNPKFNLPVFTDKIFSKGTTFQYKLEDKSSVSYQEIPVKYCRISYIEEGVYRYQVDISKITESSQEYFPLEIQRAYTSYKNGQTDKLEEGKWYSVSDKGVAFTLDNETLNQGGYTLPPFANALIDSIKIENAKDQMESTDTLDNSKIVHSKIETDERGRPLMDLPVVQEYHNALKKNLPEGSVAITNPFETKGISLNGTGKDGKFALLDKTVDQLYKGVGISGMLFAGDNTSSQALERSIEVDAQWLYSFLLPMYANYYNYELKKVNKKDIQWKMKILPNTHLFKNEAIKTAKDQLTFGGSRSEYLACTGMTPIEVANLLVFEQQVLNIDDLMVAKQTSNTLSGDSESEAGAPESDNPTDTTIRIKDSQ